MGEKKCENKCLKQLIITNNIESVSGLPHLREVSPIIEK